MSTIVHNQFRCRWGISMTPTTRKLIRGLIFTIAMGVVSLTVIVEGDAQYSPLIVGVTYIFGALLVFGIDISYVEYGKFRVQFEPSDARLQLEDDDED